MVIQTPSLRCGQLGSIRVAKNTVPARLGTWPSEALNLNKHWHHVSSGRGDGAPASQGACVLFCFVLF